MSLYDDLGVDKRATKADIKKAYREKAKACHPDIAGEPGRDEFEKVKTAYLALSDPATRKRYDQTGSVESDTVSHATKVQTAAIGRLTEMITVAVADPNVFTNPKIDIVGKIKDAIKTDIENANSNIIKMKGDIQGLWDFRKRFDKGGQMYDVTVNIVRERIQEIKRIIRLAHLQIESLELAEEMVDDLVYNFEKQEEVVFYGRPISEMHRSFFDIRTTTA